LVNIGRKTLNMMWKLHPALRISEGAEIVAPAAIARPVDPAWSRFGSQTEFNWRPETAAHFVPPLTGSTEFLYLLNLASGECALRHQLEGWCFRMTFPKEIFSSVWVFASFGGWRDLEVLILEPCTLPKLSLAECASAGACLRLAPGEAVDASVRVETGPAECL
jgi:hypothetical protein